MIKSSALCRIRHSADDFKIFTTDYHTAKKIFVAVTQWLKERLDLDISPEKSTITNIKKNHTIFFGFKLKLHPKSNKQVVKSHMSDKVRKKIITEYVKQVKQAQHSQCPNKDLWLLNSKAIGYHNYYQIATGCSKDFSSIAFIVRKAIKHRLKPKRTGTATGYNRYSNLVWVTADVHRLLHATKAETIEHYRSLVNPDKKQLSKINKLRAMLKLPCL